MKPAGLAMAHQRRPAKPRRGADAAAASRRQATHRFAGFRVRASAPVPAHFFRGLSCPPKAAYVSDGASCPQGGKIATTRFELSNMRDAASFTVGARRLTRLSVFVLARQRYIKKIQYSGRRV